MATSTIEVFQLSSARADCLPENAPHKRTATVPFIYDSDRQNDEDPPFYGVKPNRGLRLMAKNDVVLEFNGRFYCVEVSNVVLSCLNLHSAYVGTENVSCAAGRCKLKIVRIGSAQTGGRGSV